MPQAIAFILQNWKLIICGIIGVSMIAATMTLKIQRDNARENAAQLFAELAQEKLKLRVSNSSIRELESQIESQNANIARFQQEAQDRAERGRIALERAKREGREATALAKRLRETPSIGNDAGQCQTSDAIMQNRDFL